MIGNIIGAAVSCALPVSWSCARGKLTLRWVTLSTPTTSGLFRRSCRGADGEPSGSTWNPTRPASHTLRRGLRLQSDPDRLDRALLNGLALGRSVAWSPPMFPQVEGVSGTLTQGHWGHACRARCGSWCATRRSSCCPRGSRGQEPADRVRCWGRVTLLRCSATASACPLPTAHTCR